MISGWDLINNKCILKKYIYKSRVLADCVGYMRALVDLLRVCVSICLHRTSCQASGSGGSDCREWASRCRSGSACYCLWCLHRWAAQLQSGRRAEINVKPNIISILFMLQFGGWWLKWSFLLLFCHMLFFFL